MTKRVDLTDPKVRQDLRITDMKMLPEFQRMVDTMSIAIDCKEFIHPGQSCAVRALDVFKRVFINNVKMYMVVHLLPVFIFKLKLLRKEPIKTLGKAFKNVV